MWYVLIPVIVALYIGLYFFGVGRLVATLEHESLPESEWLPEMKRRIWTVRWLFLLPGVFVLRVIHAVRPR